MPRFVVWSSLLLAGLVPTAEAQSVALVGWEGKASPLSSPGASLAQFRIRAETAWPANLSRDPSRFRVRIDGPGGKAATHQWSEQDAASGRWTTAYIPVDWVRNRLPDTVKVDVTLVDAATGRAVSNTLTAGIDQFPRPSASNIVPDPGPFGWGEPVRRETGSQTPIPRSTADGLRFVVLPGTSLMACTSEVSVAQMKRRVPTYNPAAGRSDEFELDGPDQPAVGVSPATAEAYLAAISADGRSGVRFRLPTRDEWLRAARAGAETKFWWGDAPTHPAGANFAGDEPARKGDTTADALGGGFKPNKYGLVHAFGNVEEWTTVPGGFVRIGGHFRTEIEDGPPEARVAKPDDLGPDPYVGLRPFADFDPAAIAAAAGRLLAADPRLGGVRVEFDADRLTLILTGKVDQPGDRRIADEALAPIWVAAAVENRIETPKFEAGRLAEIGAPAGPPRRLTPLGRWFDEVPLNVRWAESLPVEGSEWWVNIFGPDGTRDAHRMIDEPSRNGKLLVMIDRAKFKPGSGAVEVALSLGAAASGTDDPRVVSNRSKVDGR